MCCMNGVSCYDGVPKRTGCLESGRRVWSFPFHHAELNSLQWPVLSRRPMHTWASSRGRMGRRLPPRRWKRQRKLLEVTRVVGGRCVRADLDAYPMCALHHTVTRASLRWFMCTGWHHN